MSAMNSKNLNKKGRVWLFLANFFQHPIRAFRSESQPKYKNFKNTTKKSILISGNYFNVLIY